MDTKHLNIVLTRASSIAVIIAMALAMMGSVSAQGSVPTVGLVYSETGKDDHSFNWMAYQGLLQAQAELGVMISEYTPADPGAYDSVLSQCALDGNELCIAVGFGYSVSLANAARAKPYTQWGIVDWSYPDCWEGAVVGKDCGSDKELPNVLGLTFATDEAGFLAGYVAASMTRQYGQAET